MRRWNGWGDEDIDYSLSSSDIEYLAERIGVGNRSPDAKLEDVLDQAPISQLTANHLMTIDNLERLRHARGQSLPDWIALRSGRIGVFPDGVAYPSSSNDIRVLLDYGKEQDLVLIPYGGGTSVVGHINPLPDDRPVLTIDLSHMARLKHIDDVSQLATFEAGISEPQVEDQLNSSGYTLGHFPQSFEYSTLGGWVATRSSGQQSYYYGRIEKLVAGIEVETPMGKMSIPALPASAAGPDLRQIILGSEGIFGIISEVTVRVQRIPEVDAFFGIFFRAWQPGIDAARAIAQAQIPVSMLRLSDPQETALSLILGSSQTGMASLAERLLRLLIYREERCLLIFGVTGLAVQTRTSRRHLRSITRRHIGLFVGSIVGNRWRKNRFQAPYLRNALWDQGYAVDTLETAVRWSSVPETVNLLRCAIQEGLKDIAEEVLVFSHLSHMYKDGASIYVTFIFRRSADPEETFRRWLTLKQAASQVIISQGATISHQHGVGTDHAPYLADEKGDLGIGVIEAIRQDLDPDGMMNPGKLLPDLDVKS